MAVQYAVKDLPKAVYTSNVLFQYWFRYIEFDDKNTICLMSYDVYILCISK